MRPLIFTCSVFFGRAILTALESVRMSQRPSEAMITLQPWSGMMIWPALFAV